MIKAEKKKIGELTLCYCVAPVQVDGRRCFAVASEKEYACLLFDEQGNQIDKIWDGPGGTMSIVQLPDADGAFLATQRFYSPNNCKEASIALCRKDGSAWSIRTLAELPGIHRFDILSRNGVNYLLACTIKSDYAYKDDWRFPGKVYACELPDDLLQWPEEKRLELAVLREGMLKNHGYSRNVSNGIQEGIVTSEEGVFRFVPPEKRNGEWAVEKILCEPTSDAVLLDLDMDGTKELITISPFHGNTLRIFKMQNNTYVPVYTCGREMPFLHAICPAVMGDGRPVVVIGHRQNERDLLAVSYENGGYRMDILDHDVGPANVLSYALDGKTYVLSANREQNEIAVYALNEA